ncbi:MAG: GGDEF domain-containing protein [Sphingomonas sp.]
MLLNRNFWILVLAGLAGLYGLFAVDVFHDDAAKLADRRMRLELDEFLLFGSALMLTMFAFSLNQHRARIREQSRRIEAEHNVRDLGYHDALTGIANRRAFDEALAGLLSRPVAPGTTHAVLMLDLNGFKQVNDNFGHGVGDALLMTVARRIGGAVRDGDCAARFGGDEFAVIAPHIQEEVATAIADRVAGAIAAPIEIGGHAHQVTTGIGIGLVHAPGLAPSELVRRADVALYATKRDRRSTWRLYGPELDTGA